MQIYFTYEKKKVIQALRYHFINRIEIKALILIVNVFAILSATLFYFHKVSPLAFLLSSFLWVGLMLAFWFFLPNTVYNKASTFKDAFKMTFSDQYVKIENESGQTEWQWNQFSDTLESPHFIHLYFDTKSFFLVPKTAIEKDGNLNDLRVLLKEKIVNRKR